MGWASRSSWPKVTASGGLGEEVTAATVSAEGERTESPVTTHMTLS